METLTPRQIKNRVRKQEAEVEGHKNQKAVKKLIVSIEWKKSRMWGNCPSAEAKVYFQDGTFERRDGYRAGGYGYDKESTVVAQIFNDFLRYKLYQKHKWEDSINCEKTNHPYGVYYYGGGVDKDTRDTRYYIRKPSFNGGVGMSCYPSIGKFLGGTLEHTASGKTFDVYTYEDKRREG